MKSMLSLVLLLALGAMLAAGDVIFADGKVEGVLGKGVTLEGKELVWTFQPPKSRFQINLKEKDLSAYNAIEITFDASRAGDKTVICFASNPEGATEYNYYFADETVAKTGVQTWTIPFAKCKSVRKPAGWNNISMIQIQFEGWNLKTEPGLTLKVQSIKLIKQ